MKKTVSVNIKGINFLIEEDAYELLQDYMNRLALTLKNESGSKEIIEDVELRIAEICSTKITETKTVIELNDIEEILAALGTPEDYVDGDEASDNSQKESTTQQAERRLFRDTENATIAGVCKGIANYFNIDVVIIRAIFVVIFLFGGFGIPLYIILWIVIPKAKTTIDKLRMKGQPITVESVRSEVEGAADKFKTGAKNLSQRIRRDRQPRNKFVTFLKVLTSLIGIGLLIFGFLFLVLFLVFGVGGMQFIPIQTDNGFLSMPEFGELVLSGSKDLSTFWIGSLLTGASMILFMLLLGFMLIVRLKNKWANLSLLTLFVSGIIGFFMCLSVGMNTGKDFIIGAEIERTVGSAQTVELVIVPITNMGENSEQFNVKSDGNMGPLKIEGDSVIFSGVYFEFIPSSDSLFHVKQNIIARGKTHEKGISRCKNIAHEIALKSDSLFVDPEFRFPKKDKLRDQEVYVIVEIPEGSQVRFKNRIIKLGAYEIDPTDHDANYHEKGFLNGDGEYHHDSW